MKRLRRATISREIARLRKHWRLDRNDHHWSYCRRDLQTCVFRESAFV